MDDDSAKPHEQLRQELAELRQQRAVEQAAERIREQVLAMRHSDDLATVAGVLYEEMNHLGVETPVAAINLIDEAGGQTHDYNATDNPRPCDPSWRPSSQRGYRLVEVNAHTLVWTGSLSIAHAEADGADANSSRK